MTPSGPDPDGGLTRPDGSTIDLALVRAVATETNRAQRRMGTQLLSIERHGVTIFVPWQRDLTDATGALAPGVLAALLDHACSLAALVSLDDPARFGTTMGLRVDQLAQPAAERPVHACAEAIHEGDRVMTVHGRAYDKRDPERPLARAVCTVAVAR